MRSKDSLLSISVKKVSVFDLWSNQAESTGSRQITEVK